MATTLHSNTSIAIAARLLREKADAATRRALDKAEYHLVRGLDVVAGAEGVLVPSASSTEVYTVSAGRCTCKASGVCWHLQAVEILIYAKPVRYEGSIDDLFN